MLNQTLCVWESILITQCDLYHGEPFRFYFRFKSDIKVEFLQYLQRFKDIQYKSFLLPYLLVLGQNFCLRRKNPLKLFTTYPIAHHWFTDRMSSFFKFLPAKSKRMIVVITEIVSPLALLLKSFQLPRIYSKGTKRRGCNRSRNIRTLTHLGDMEMSGV